MTQGINEVFPLSSACAGQVNHLLALSPFLPTPCLSDSTDNDNKVADAFEIRHH